MGTDSAAAKSFVSRRGLGKMRHLEVRDLWLQEEVLRGSVRVEKIPGDRNPADLMTKFLGWKEIEGRLEGLGIEVRPGWKEREPRVGGAVESQPKRGKRQRGLMTGRWADELDDDVAEEGDLIEWCNEVFGDPSGSATIGRVGGTPPSPRISGEESVNVAMEPGGVTLKCC